jgi:hypothetical protein
LKLAAHEKMLSAWNRPFERQGCRQLQLHLRSLFGLPRFEADGFKNARDK